MISAPNRMHPLSNADLHSASSPASLVGQRAVWKIRVHGPAKFAERHGTIAFISGQSAFTRDGHQLRLGDMVATPDAVIGGGSWAVALDLMEPEETTE